jgi:Peptidase family S41
MKQYILALYFLIVGFNLHSQNTANVLADFNFLAEKLRTEYIGYDLKEPKKIERLLNTAKNNLTRDPTNEKLFKEFSKVLLRLKDLHIRFFFFRNNDSIENGNKKNNTNDFLNKPINSRDEMEGYWKSDLNDMVIVIKKDAKLNYKGYITECRNEKYKQGNKLFDLAYSSPGLFAASIMRRDKNMFLPLVVNFKNELLMGVVWKWVKIKNYLPNYLINYTQFDYTPEFKQVNKEWSVIKIPRSDLKTKKSVDSLVYLNKGIIEESENLIIDIRNNTGGTWRVYDSLYKYIYTNIIMSNASLYKCTEGLINDQRTYLKEEENSPTLLSASFYRKEKALLDSFVKNYGKMYFEKEDTVAFYNTAYTYPKHIYILSNVKCVSASEMFLEFCKQSKKVKTYGEKTFGGADYVQAISYKTKNELFELSLPSVKCIYNEDKRMIDFNGIKPSVEISDNTNDWIQFVIDSNKNK